MLFKKIPLIPTNFTLDIWIGDTSKVWPVYKSYYGILETDNLNIEDKEVATLYLDIENEKLKIIRIVMKLLSLDSKDIIVHEIIHIIWHLAKEVGYKMVYDSQEWQAVLAEWLYNEILKENYEIMPD